MYRFGHQRIVCLAFRRNLLDAICRFPSVLGRDGNHALSGIYVHPSGRHDLILPGRLVWFTVRFVPRFVVDLHARHSLSYLSVTPVECPPFGRAETEAARVPQFHDCSTIGDLHPFHRRCIRHNAFVQWDVWRNVPSFEHGRREPGDFNIGQYHMHAEKHGCHSFGYPVFVRDNRSDIRLQYLRCRCLYLHDLYERRKAERKCDDDPSRASLFWVLQDPVLRKISR